MEYLADALLSGVRTVTISDVREREEHGIHCEVIVPVRVFASAPIEWRMFSPPGSSDGMEMLRVW